MSGESAAHQVIAPDVKLGRNVWIHAFVNLYGCETGDETRIGPFVEAQRAQRLASGERYRATPLSAKA
jgi:UDP-3-O-[3-hydroxymyristoyl] glucosamine N-acyltransferase